MKPPNVLGYCCREGIIARSDGIHCKQAPFLDFLLEPAPDCFKVFYDFDSDTARLFALIQLTREEGTALLSEGKLFIPPYTLTLIPGKFLSIKKGSYFTFITDVQQYSSHPPLFESHQHPVQRASAAKVLGERVVQTLHHLGMTPTSITSPVRAYEKEILGKLDLPTIDHIPSPVLPIAYSCAKGGWVEAYKLGHWKRAYVYDIDSAYPSVAASLPDIRRGKWIHSSNIPAHSYLGFVRGKCSIRHPVSPIIARLERKGEASNYTPTGTWEDCFTLDEARWLQSTPGCSLEIQEGYFWVPTAPFRYPLLEKMVELHEQKGKHYGVAREVIKRIMVGVYGKMLEMRGETPGPLFNPVYAATIEARTRINLWNYIPDKSKLIHVAVDGFISEVERTRPEGETEFGGLKLSKVASVFVAGSSAVAVADEERPGDFSLDFDWLAGQITKLPDDNEYVMEKLTPWTLASAVHSDDWLSLGTLRKQTRSVFIGKEVKRLYKKQPRDGEELWKGQYLSVPWDASVLKVAGND